MANYLNGQHSRVQELEGERGMPSVNESGPTTLQRSIIIACILLIAALGGFVTYWKYHKSKEKEAEANKKENIQIKSTVPEHTFPDIPAKTGATAITPQTSEAPPLPGNNANTSNNPLTVLDKSDSDLMVVDNKPAESNKQQTANLQPESQGGALSGALTSTQTLAHSANMLGNRNFILAKGSFINCVLQTKLDSTVPGMTECRVSRNIYSDNGKVLLIERGSTASGEYQSNMRQGMARIFVLWTRIKTPNGVIIPLNSPGTDPLGGSGLPGYVDSHFWQRFGGALMLSLIDDAAKGYVASKQNSSGGQANFNFNSTTGASQTMAAEALTNTINIPPTLYKNQGEEIGIYVARDLNFSSVYHVAAE